MNIPEMHSYFRQYAQQMGMQIVRGILPEQIDILLNTSIIDTVNQIIRENVGISNDRVTRDNAKISQLNAIRPLYRVKEIELLNTDTGGDGDGGLVDPTGYSVNSKLRNAMSTDYPFIYDSSDYFNGKYTLNSAYSLPKYMYIVDFSLNYCKCTTGWTADSAPVRDDSISSFTTNYFSVRLIEDSVLSDTLNDAILKNRIRSPITVLYTSDNGILNMELYTDKFDKTKHLLKNNLAPYKLRFSYIAAPAKVSYSEDISGENVDCDLPEYLHVDIIKHAVDLYRIAVGNSLHANSEQAKAQQQEDYRNQ